MSAMAREPIPTEDLSGGDPELEPVEVEVEGEVEAEGAAAPAEAAPAATPKKSRADRRIETLTKRGQEVDTYAQRLQRENDELRQENGQEKERARLADESAVTHYEERTNLSIAAAQRDLEDAIAQGDAKVQAEIEVRLSGLQSDRSRLNTYKQQRGYAAEKAKTNGAAQPEQGKQPDPGRQQAQLSQPVQAFVAENSWFNPQSSEFNPDMHTFAVAEATIVEGRYRRAGRGEEIGSPEYFDAVLERVRAEFPDEMEDDDGDDDPPVRAARVPPMSKPNGGVAPGGRSASPAAGGGAKTKVTLTREERGMAHQLADSGAVMHETGRRLTHAEAERQYAIQKVRQTT